MITLESKVALVTGATSGIGKATALALGSAGAKVVFSGRREPEGEATAALMRNAGAECLFVRSDVSSEEDVKALVQKTIQTYGRLDCAFNNAGIGPLSKPLHEQSLEDFDKLMAINVRGLFLCMKYEIKQMLSQGSGVIVLNSTRLSPTPLVFKTVLNSFPLHGSSMIWHICHVYFTAEPSSVVFSSWQCLCNIWRFLYSSLPPFFLGVMWSISSTSDSRKYNPQ